MTLRSTAEVGEFEARPGDLLLLCTDGLSNMVVEEDMARTLAQSSSPQAAADRLVQMASKSGGKDNITAVVARLQVGTRTQRFNVADFVRSKSPAVSAVNTEAAPEAEENAGLEPERPNEFAAPPPARRRRSRTRLVWPMLAAVLTALGVGTSAWLGSLLARDGYQFRATPPFAVKPALPLPPPPPPDPAHVVMTRPKVSTSTPCAAIC